MEFAYPLTSGGGGAVAGDEQKKSREEKMVWWSHEQNYALLLELVPETLQTGINLGWQVPAVSLDSRRSLAPSVLVSMLGDLAVPFSCIQACN